MLGILARLQMHRRVRILEMQNSRVTTLEMDRRVTVLEMHSSRATVLEMHRRVAILEMHRRVAMPHHLVGLRRMPHYLVGLRRATVPGNATADLATSILAVHNSARANVTVPPLVWNVTLAAGAKAWAEHLAATGKFEHSSGYMPRFEYGESIASRGQTTTVPLAQMQQGWIFEKNNYHGGPINETNAGLISHYTMMVWRTTTSIGCGTASGGGRDILVCRYSPGPTHGGGNTFGQKPY